MGSYFELKDPKKIKKEIKYSGNSLSSFASLVGISTTSLINTLEKKKRTRPKTANKIASGLGVSINDIFFDSDASKSTQN